MVLCEYPNRYVNLSSGLIVRFVSVIRRTVLNITGDLFTCGQASVAVGALDGPMGMDSPLGMFGFASRS
jgi:hypothetical protein